MKKQKKNYTYCRVSSNNQKEDLKRQQAYVQDFCFNKGITAIALSDIGSGLNYKRKNFLKLIKLIITNEVDELVIAHRDRLVRFGFDLIQWLCDEYNVTLSIIDNEQMSPSEEMTKDLISIIHVFSSRFYGLRNYAEKIKKDCEVS
jgi:putative resolvase